MSSAGDNEGATLVALVESAWVVGVDEMAGSGVALSTGVLLLFALSSAVGLVAMAVVDNDTAALGVSWADLMVAERGVAAAAAVFDVELLALANAAAEAGPWSDELLFAGCSRLA
jgi:hypothetical protein